MPSLTPGANAPLPSASTYTLRLKTAAAHADLVVLCVRADGTADGDNGVALWTQPQCAGGAVRIDPATDTVTVSPGRLPADVTRLLVVAQADGVADMSATRSVSADIAADGRSAATLEIASPPPYPTVQVGELYRHGGGFKARCLGDGYKDGLARLLEVHGIEVVDEPAAAPASATPVDMEKRRRVDLLKKVEQSGNISLVKKVQAAAVSLDKHGLGGVRAEVVLVLDVSGSSRGLFRSGVYQQLVERFFAAALHFDDNGTIDTYLFDSKLREGEPVTLKNLETWAHDVAARKDIWGLTKYAPPIEEISKGLRRGNSMPTYVAFITDGGNQDGKQAEKAIRAASGLPAFFQFMAIGRESDFPFLSKLDELSGREIDNAGFFAVQDPKALSDKAFYAKVMVEFPQWLPAARRAGILG